MECCRTTTTVVAPLTIRFGNERSITGGFHCPLSRSLPAIPAARGRERNIQRTVIDRSFLGLDQASERTLGKAFARVEGNFYERNWFALRRVGRCFYFRQAFQSWLQHGDVVGGFGDRRHVRRFREGAFRDFIQVALPVLGL